MKRSMPNHAPLIASRCICQTCGRDMDVKVNMGRNGVTGITYSCTNNESGCSYKVEDTRYLTGQAEGIRMDGKVA